MLIWLTNACMILPNCYDCNQKMTPTLPSTRSFSGKYSWRGPKDMDFAFTHFLVSFAGRELVNKPREASPKTWTFFHAGPNIAAARSSAGGLNLMRRESALQ